MCGILCICSKEDGDPVAQELLDTILPLLKNRGPDSIDTLIEDKIHFIGSVLWQQGPQPTSQPLQNEEYILLFNGDIFNANSPGESDTSWLFTALNNSQTEDQLLDIFQTAQGPYSFVLYKKTTRTLYWARDSLGRNSLVMGHHCNVFYISSVNGIGVRSDAVMEVPPLGIYALDIDQQAVTLTPWSENMFEVDYYQERFEEAQKFFEIGNVTLILNERSLNPQWLQNVNNQSPSFRFDDLLKDSLQMDPDIVFQQLMKTAAVSSTIKTFIQLLSSSVEDRIRHTPQICKFCSRDGPPCTHPKIGILFSGGVDCTLLAVLADKFVQPNLPINLYNVAFEKVSKNDLNREPNWNVPDRLSALEAIEELRSINPNRVWNLVEINVPRREVDKELVNTVKHLVYPLTTVLDESLGGALWFASGGGVKSAPDHCCRVLLIGSGADELLGGYTRHRTAYRRTGDVEEELLHDWHRLPSRNLARDDRVISDNGVTPRAPFVEENLVGLLRNLHPMQKCYHGLAEGLGDKLLLRVAAFQLGLQCTATRRKRALQFGSRIADSRQSAKDKSRLLE